jgi:hypothetical protein
VHGGALMRRELSFSPSLLCVPKIRFGIDAIIPIDCRSRTPCFLAMRLSPLIAACSSLASVGKLMFLGCTVVSIVTRARSFVRSAPPSRTVRADRQCRGVQGRSRERDDRALVLFHQRVLGETRIRAPVWTIVVDHRGFSKGCVAEVP